MRHRPGLVALSGLVFIVGFLLLAPQAATAQQMQMMPPGQAELVRSLLPTVVNIISYVNASETANLNAGSTSASQDQSQPTTTQGSGFVIDTSGVILTNNHVIAGAYDVHVTFSDGVSVPARVLATAPRIDLALVKVDTQHPLTATRWGDSNTVQVGDTVFAIGNPLGVGLSVSSGIISALNRNIMDTPYDDFIQTDAAINHGNSGGPLFNRDGEVIGVDTAIISPTTGSVGLGFAIPANDAKFVAGRLLRDGHVNVGYLGLKIEQVTYDMALALGMSAPTGSIVASVHAGGPAGVAGLQVGDVVLHFDNQTPPDERALLRAIARSTIGQAVPIGILRDGHELTLQITPAEWPEMTTATTAAAGTASNPIMLVPPNLGLSLRAVTPDLRARYGLQTRQGGVLINGVAAGTDAFERGLKAGDVILRVQDTEVDSPDAVQKAVDAARASDKSFVLALVLPKVQDTNPGPRWMALRVLDKFNQTSQ